MATGYVNFCFAFDLPDAEKAKAAAELLREIENLIGEGEFGDWPDELGDFRRFEYGLDVRLDRDGNTLSIRDGAGHSNLDGVARYVQEVLTRFYPEGAIIIEYAVTCTRHIAGAFGGGVVMVTASKVESADSYELGIAWLKEQRTAREAEKNPDPEKHYLCTKCGRANVAVSVPAFFLPNEDWRASTVDVDLEAKALAYFCNDCGEETSVRKPTNPNSAKA